MGFGARSWAWGQRTVVPCGDGALGPPVALGETLRNLPNGCAIYTGHLDLSS